MTPLAAASRSTAAVLRRTGMEALACCLVIVTLFLLSWWVLLGVLAWWVVRGRWPAQLHVGLAGQGSRGGWRRATTALVHPRMGEVHPRMGEVHPAPMNQQRSTMPYPSGPGE